nr:vitelline membrane protein 15a-2-like [Aedes albopictus]
MHAVHIASVLIITIVTRTLAMPPLGSHPHGYPEAMANPYPMEETPPTPPPPVSPTCGSNLLIGCGDAQADPVPCTPDHQEQHQYDRPPPDHRFEWHRGQSYHRSLNSDMDEGDSFEE